MICSTSNVTGERSKGCPGTRSWSVPEDGGCVSVSGEAPPTSTLTDTRTSYWRWRPWLVPVSSSGHWPSSLPCSGSWSKPSGHEDEVEVGSVGVHLWRCLGGDFVDVHPTTHYYQKLCSSKIHIRICYGSLWHTKYTSGLDSVKLLLLKIIVEEVVNSSNCGENTTIIWCVYACRKYGLHYSKF